MTQVIFPISAELIELHRVAKNMSVKFRTVRSWHLRGVRNASGGKIKLEVQRVGQSLYTTPEALGKFIKAQRGAPLDSPNGQPPAQPQRSPRPSTRPAS